MARTRPALLACIPSCACCCACCCACLSRPSQALRGGTYARSMHGCSRPCFCWLLLHSPSRLHCDSPKTWDQSCMSHLPATSHHEARLAARKESKDFHDLIDPLSCTSCARARLLTASAPLASQSGSWSREETDGAQTN